MTFVLSLGVLDCNEKFIFKIIDEHSTEIGVFWWLCDEEDIGWELQGPGSRLYLPGRRCHVTLWPLFGSQFPHAKIRRVRV